MLDCQFLNLNVNKKFILISQNFNAFLYFKESFYFKMHYALFFFKLKFNIRCINFKITFITFTLSFIAKGGCGYQIYNIKATTTYTQYKRRGFKNLAMAFTTAYEM